jgi:hypothetical protein
MPTVYEPNKKKFYSSRAWAQKKKRLRAEKEARKRNKRRKGR